MTISIGNDHAGTQYKQAIQAYLEEKGYTVLPTPSGDEAIQIVDNQRVDIVFFEEQLYIVEQL